MFGSMGKRVKGYLVFTSKIYRIIIYLLMPAALTALGVWTGAHVGDTRLALVLMAMLLALTEVVSDAWLFGGLQARDAEKMDYLKVSGRGMALMRNALALDLFRKFLTALCTIGAAYLIIGQVKGGCRGRWSRQWISSAAETFFRKPGLWRIWYCWLTGLRHWGLFCPDTAALFREISCWDMEPWCWQAWRGCWGRPLCSIPPGDFPSGSAVPGGGNRSQRSGGEGRHGESGRRIS